MFINEGFSSSLHHVIIMILRHELDSACAVFADVNRNVTPDSILLNVREATISNPHWFIVICRSTKVHSSKALPVPSGVLHHGMTREGAVIRTILPFISDKT